MARIIKVLLAIWLLGLGLAASAEPDDDEAPATPSASASPQGIMNKLLAPGPLMEGHKKLEQTDCLSCHDAGNGVPDKLCLDCHKDIRASMSKGKSFHALTKQPCIACHSDHKGREFDSTVVDSATFDHKTTGFPLSKAHAKVKCDECHKQTRTDKPIRSDDTRYFGDAATCVSCHKKDDPHFFTGKTAKKDCGVCHSDNTWKEQITYDHKKDTGFPLLGKHAKISCEECHKPDLSKKLPKGEKAFQWTGLKQACNSCHADYHGFDGLKGVKLGALADCQTCHKETSWKTQINFNHDTQTRYKIDGKHEGVACNECHKPLSQQKPWPNVLRQYKWPDLETKTCENCHKSPHVGKFPPKLLAKACTDCHVTSSWTSLPQLEKGFDHNRLTKFALTGKHSQIECKDCHVKNGKDVYKFPNEAKQFCVSCHSNIHRDQFRRDYPSDGCADCHGTKSFAKLKPFNHDTQTKFKLTGDHLRIKSKCADCHTPTSLKLTTKPPKFGGRFMFAHAETDYCVDCHKNVHVGQFHPEFADKSCSVCHTTKNFTERLPFDHHSTHYDIKGKHLKLRCEECHTPTAEKFPRPSKHVKGKFIFADLKSKNCASCHKDVHKGSFGPRCMDCHTEVHNWSSIEDFHKNFTLSGVHNLLTCEQCHGIDNGRRLTGSSERCVFCHQKDDAHNHGLPECAECHTQQTWQMTTFHHSMTEFPLLGAHRVVECNACHRNGIYDGTPTDCASCHAGEARGVTFPNHSLPGFEQCGDCHNQFSFGVKTK